MSGTVEMKPDLFLIYREINLQLLYFNECLYKYNTYNIDEVLF